MIFLKNDGINCSHYGKRNKNMSELIELDELLEEEKDAINKT